MDEETNPEGRELASDEQAEKGYVKHYCFLNCRFGNLHCVRGKYYQFSFPMPDSYFERLPDGNAS